MDRKKAQNFIDRLKNVLNCIRHQNSGADIHNIGNIRNTTSGLLTLLEQDPTCMAEETVERMVKNAEKSVVQHFKSKYPEK